MSVAVFNTAKAVEVLAHIEDVRETNDKISHSQRNWGSASVSTEDLDKVYDSKTQKLIGYGSCNTSHCFAGWTAQLSGEKLIWNIVDRGMPSSFVELSAEFVEGGNTISSSAIKHLGIPVPGSTCEHPECRDLVSSYEVETVKRLRELHPEWDFDEDWPELFSPRLSLPSMYRIIAHYADLTVEELHDLVDAEREKWRLKNLFALKRVQMASEEPVKAPVSAEEVVA